MAKIEDISLKARIYKHIRGMILRQELKQGEKIPEAAIAKELNISRTPVREAVRRLAWEGIIVIEPNKSATVRTISEHTIRDLAAVRWQHDRLNIPLVVYNGSNKDFDDLKELAAKCIAYNKSGNMDMRHKFDAKFHMKLYEIGGNEILIELHQHLELLVQLWQVSHINERGMMQDGLLQHYQIIEDLQKRDAEKALNDLYQHYVMAYGVEIEGEMTPPPAIALR